MHSKIDNIDPKILSGCIKKKLKYQEMLYRKFYAYGMSITLRYTKNREDALEVLNDSFLKVFENITRFDTKKSFKAWFRQITVNTSIDNIRKNKRTVITENIDDLRSENFYKKEIDDLETEDLLNILHSLPEHYALIFNLYEIEGYKHYEIAEMLNINESTSRANLSRAKKMLRNYIINSEKNNYVEAV